MLRYEEITETDIGKLAELYVETFHAPPWNDGWTIETASKRLHQMINVEDFYGLCAYEEDELCGMLLGSREQYYNGVLFNLNEFCVKNSRRGKGLGTQMLSHFEACLKEQGVDEMLLFTAKGEQTEGFYRKRGMIQQEGMIMMGKKL